MSVRIRAITAIMSLLVALGTACDGSKGHGHPSVPADAAVMDAGAADGAAPDAATSDAALADAGPGDAAMDASSGDGSTTDAATPDAAACASCDDGDACTADGCEGASGTCRHVQRDRCADPSCALGDCAGTDTDGDGLSDAWETQGYVDIDCDGAFDAASDLELPGADPRVLDVYVEYDYMTKAGAGNACQSDDACTVSGERCVDHVCTHTHVLDAAAEQEVRDAFAAHDINLHLDPVHDALPEHAVVTFGTLDVACAGEDAVSFWALKAAHFDPRRRWVYRYAILGHHHTCGAAGACAMCPLDPISAKLPAFGSSGTAELPGNDFIVALGRRDDLALARTPESQAGTFMHELGHTLDLRHGGGENAPEFKPNYLSVMGEFQFTGVPFAASVGSDGPIVGHRVDYSASTLSRLDESALDESAGLGGLTADLTAFQNGQSADAFGPTSGPVDWNGSGDTDGSPVKVDVNYDGAYTVLNGWTDWPSACKVETDCPTSPAMGQVPCVNGRCLTLRPAFQCTTGGMSDAAPPPISVFLTNAVKRIRCQ